MCDYVKPLFSDIYLKTLNVQEISEVPTYTPSGFISALGGALSLSLGISLIMIVELVELVFDLLTQCLRC